MPACDSMGRRAVFSHNCPGCIPGQYSGHLVDHNTLPPATLAASSRHGAALRVVVLTPASLCSSGHTTPDHTRVLNSPRANGRERCSVKSSPGGALAYVCTCPFFFTFYTDCALPWEICPRRPTLAPCSFSSHPRCIHTMVAVSSWICFRALSGPSPLLGRPFYAWRHFLNLVSSCFRVFLSRRVLVVPYASSAADCPLPFICALDGGWCWRHAVVLERGWSTTSYQHLHTWRR